MKDDSTSREGDSLAPEEMARPGQSEDGRVPERGGDVVRVKYHLSLLDGPEDGSLVCRGRHLCLHPDLDSWPLNWRE